MRDESRATLGASSETQQSQLMERSPEQQRRYAVARPAVPRCAAQLFASDHRMTKARVAGRAIIAERASWNALTAMCGAR